MIKQYNKKALCVIFLIMHSAFSFSQVNLVINPSFEIVDTCPTIYGQVPLAYGWDTLRNGGGCTPDLYNSCDTSAFGYYGVPINLKGYQYAKSGECYAGLFSFYAAPDVREYMQGTLLDILQENKTYCIKMNVNLSNDSKYSIKTLGILVDDGSAHTSSYFCDLPGITPQIVSNLQLMDTLNWMKIEGNYFANGTEEYITIGNFFPDSLSNPILTNSQGAGVAAYYYFDDISVIETDLPAFAGNDTIINSGDSVFIGRQPEIGLNDDCVWFASGTAIDTVAGLWVYPDSTTTYVLVQTICGNVDIDSVTVYVFPVGIDENATWLRKANVYPNPCNGSITISLNESPDQSPEVLVRVCDLTGSIVETFKLQIKNNKAVLNMNLPDGMYIISVSDENGNSYHPRKITVIN